MTTSQWREFLTEFSRELLEVPEELHNVSAEAIKTGWMGFSPATEEQILTAEARIGKRLPPSLRSFYTVTNGWRDVSSFIYDILPVEKIDWLPVLWPSLYTEQKYIDLELYRETDQDQINWIHESYVYVNRSLVITSHGDAGRFLLDPERMDQDGEWMAGHCASWIPGMHWKASSFAGLIKVAREESREMKK